MPLPQPPSPSPAADAQEAVEALEDCLLACKGYCLARSESDPAGWAWYLRQVVHWEQYARGVRTWLDTGHDPEKTLEFALHALEKFLASAWGLAAHYHRTDPLWPFYRVLARHAPRRPLGARFLERMVPPPPGTP